VQLVRTNYRRRVSALLGVPALVCVLGLSACGSFDSSKGADLIRQFMKQNGKGVSVQSVSCPSGVSQKTGGTYNCEMAWKFSAKTFKATVTVHMLGSNKIEMHTSDIRVHS
jgi:NAD(P)H-hydrate repair Nnr-like enzyme with NAD(P)H-hydrate epimerase domain